MLSLKTLASLEEKSVSGHTNPKCSERVTVLSASNASGGLKLKFTIIGKSTKFEALKNKP